MNALTIDGIKLLSAGFGVSLFLVAFYRLACLLHLPHGFRYRLLKAGHYLVYAVPIGYLFSSFALFQRAAPVEKQLPALSSSNFASPLSQWVGVSPAQATGFSALSMGVLIYAMIVAWLLFRLFAKYRSMRKVLGSSDSVTLKSGVSLFLCERLKSPISFGLVHPQVYLPKDLYASLSPERLQAIVGHELVHVQRMDFLLKFSSLFQECLLFPSPFSRYLSRAIELEMEISCDELVIAKRKISAREYGQMLLDISLISTEESFATGVATHIEKRIIAMKETYRIRRAAQWTIVTCLFASFLTVSAFALGGVAERKHPLGKMDSKALLAAMRRVKCEANFQAERVLINVQEGQKVVVFDEPEKRLQEFRGHKIGVFYYADDSLGLLVDGATNTTYNVSSLAPNLLTFLTLKDTTEIKCYSAQNLPSVTLDMELEVDGKYDSSPRIVLPFGTKGAVSMGSDKAVAYSIEVIPELQEKDSVLLVLTVSRVVNGKSEVALTSRVVTQNKTQAMLERKQVGFPDLKLSITPFF